MDDSGQLGGAQEQASQNVVDNVFGARRCSLRREFDSRDELGGVRESALEYDDEQTGPDEPLGDRRFLGVETVQICVGLALLKEQLDLPAQAVQVADFGARELRPLEVRVQINKCLLIARAPLVKGNEPAAIGFRSRRPFDLDVDTTGREPLPAERLAFDVP